MKHFLYFEKKEKHCMMKQIEIITECISACDEIKLFGYGYKSHSSRGAQDQFDNVTSLINIYKHSLVILHSLSHINKNCHVYILIFVGPCEQTRETLSPLNLCDFLDSFCRILVLADFELPLT
jgi:hypothetical protein